MTASGIEDMMRRGETKCERIDRQMTVRHSSHATEWHTVMTIRKLAQKTFQRTAAYKASTCMLQAM